MTVDQLITMVELVGGTLELADNDRVHYRIPVGHEPLVAELAARKEQIRAMLRNRRNVARPTRAPKQAPPIAEPAFITPACTCSKYSFAHVHAPERNLKVQRMDGDRFFRWLKEQVTAGGRAASGTTG